MSKTLGIVNTIIIVGIFLLVTLGYGQEISSYLILEDITGFRASKNPSSGQGPGILAGAGHFYQDHKDMTYRISYFNLETKVGPEIQITQHAGADSDRWLLHEVDISFRNYYGIPSLSYDVESMEGNTILISSVGGYNYRWLSGNKVLMIGYTDLQMTKPQPLEVVKAYLAKHPSTLPVITLQELRSPANKTIWIKDEMERRLWLCDKWFLQLQLGKVELDDALESVVKSMAIFLDYREKYYGIKARDEKIALMESLEKKDGTSIKSKLSTYKTWWAVNKGRSISLP